MPSKLKLAVLFILIVLVFSGCATLPTGDGLPVYSIGGTAYYPLVSLCELRGVDFKYDTLTMAAALAKDGKRINLRPGSTLILVDDRPMRLKEPVDIYQGAVVVPRQFKEQIIDVLFKPSALARKYGAAKIKLSKIVIDAGHGGNDPGAIGRSGLREKDVNLDIAKRLSKLLRQEGVETVMTRSGDKFIPLPNRVSIANGSGADLFVSIHSNASRSRSLNGFEVYYVAPSVSDSKRASSAWRGENLNLKGAEFASSSADLKMIVWDMVYTNSRAESIKLSNALCKVIDKDIGVKILGVKAARFQVLKGIKIPGVLIETSFISNSGEEKLLKSNIYRQKMAEGILEGLRNYSQDMALAEVSGR